MSGSIRNRPNVVFIMSDDQGPWALGCSGNKEILTPNLDRLAGEGMRFDRFFCTSPVCSPARASVLTGKIPSSHGIHDFLRDADNDRISYLDGHLAYTELLAREGYVCGMSGKWGMGNDYEPQKGFEHWYVCVYDGGRYMNPKMVCNGDVRREQGYLTELITDDSLAFLDRHADGERPFYLNVHYTAPHHLWVGEHPEEYVRLYDDCPFESCPQEPEHPWSLSLTSPTSVRTDPRANLKGYFAAVTAMDDGIGRILAKLDELGVRDNTLICFMSDNGFSCGHNGIWGKGNGTYPQNMYENSVLVPAIFQHPGVIPPGVVHSGLLSQYDFMPTLLDYLGVDHPTAEQLPGRSFKRTLLGEAASENEFVVVFDEYGPVRMIRTPTHKYIHRYPFGPHEFYGLANDPGEHVNLYDDTEAQPLIYRLQTQLESWFLQYTDPGMDGAKLPVTGTGQSDWVTPGKTGKHTFNQNARLFKQNGHL